MSAVLHHPVRTVLVALSVLVVTFVSYRWAASAVHPVSAATALDRFRSQSTATGGSAPLQPAAGVYMYTGTGSQHVSVPPKTLTDGPDMPGTVTRQAGGCWKIRIDFSDAHWEGSSYCPSDGQLLQTGREGWMKWDFIAIVVADKSTYTCDPPETAIPSNRTSGTPQNFSCRGSNDSLNTGPVVMSGTTQVMGIEPLTVGGQRIDTLHVREIATFSGGQTGSHATDLWYGPNGLPIRVKWSEEVHTPSPIGTATMTGSGQYDLVSLVPRT